MEELRGMIESVFEMELEGEPEKESVRNMMGHTLYDGIMPFKNVENGVDRAVKLLERWTLIGQIYNMTNGANDEG